MKTTISLSEPEILFQKYKEQAIKDYFTFLEFKSISSEPAFKQDVLQCCDWVKQYLIDLGFEVEIWPTSGHPTIFAHYDKAGPSQPTLLIYNHYDVQPVDPLELWETPPFTPTVRDGQVYARGAQDNKGQCFYVLLALKALMESQGGLPVNVKLCIEGEEECGSAGLSGLLASKKTELQADYLAIVDLGLPRMNQPTLTLGVRGLVTMDVIVTGTKADLHSGSHGGLAYNPIHALVEILAKARDPSGKIAIPGFYDDIQDLTAEDRQQVSWDFDEKEYLNLFGVLPTGGEKGRPAKERNWMRPTFEVNGINGGYSGAGFKTVIPSTAHAKISCRLVPRQDPDKVGKLVSDYLKSMAPEGLQVQVHVHKGHGKALHAKMDSQVTKAFAEAYSRVFKRPCQYIYSGASIPIVTELALTSESEVILVGLGLPDDNIHAPNEHFGLDRIEKGFYTIFHALNFLRNHEGDKV